MIFGVQLGDCLSNWAYSLKDVHVLGWAQKLCAYFNGPTLLHQKIESGQGKIHGRSLQIIECIDYYNKKGDENLPKRGTGQGLVRLFLQRLVQGFKLNCQKI